MTILYFEPLGKAFERMKSALFKPFDLHKWLIVGFNAFLAGLLQGHNGGGSSRVSGGKGRISFRRFLDLPRTAWTWLTDHPGWAALIVFAVFLITAFMILITWLSSRGTFMFLDSVALTRAEISKPWREYRREADSLFLWRLAFGVICWVFVIVLVAAFFSGASYLYHEAHPGRVPVLFIAVMVLIFLLFLVVTGYISLFLTGFVAPLQFKHRLKATQAWRRFLPLLGRHPSHFLLFGIFNFILNFAVIMLIIFAGLITCCIGLLILIIPYVGTVATLPIWYTLRAFSLEYLAQFGEEYDLFPAPETTLTPEAA